MQFSIQPQFPLWMLISGAIAIAIFVILVLRERANLTRSQRTTLFLLRISILTLLFLSLLRPGVSFNRETAPEGGVSVLLDRSLSMTLPSGIGSESRWQIAKGLVQKLGSQTSSLPEGMSLKLFTFDSQIRKLSGVKSEIEESDVDYNTQFQEAVKLLEEAPNGSLTDIGNPLKAVIDEASELPLQAVIWLSDGVQTADSARSNPRQVARQLAEANIPLFLVGIGPRSGSVESLDQWVDTVPEQIDAFAKNIVNVRGLLKTVGLANRELKITATLKTLKARTLPLKYK